MTNGLNYQSGKNVGINLTNPICCPKSLYYPQYSRCGSLTKNHYPTEFPAPKSQYNPNNLLWCQEGYYGENAKMCEYTDLIVGNIYCKGNANNLCKNLNECYVSPSCTTSLTKIYPYLCKNGLACSSTVHPYYVSMGVIEYIK